MPTKTLHVCDQCHGAEHSLEYKLEATNFSNVTFSFYPVSGGPHHMHGPSTADMRNETFLICNECKVAFLADLDALIAPLKA